jgi:hypothetical protein
LIDGCGESIVEKACNRDECQDMRVRTEIEPSIRASRLSGCDRSMERMQLAQSRQRQEHCAAM